MSLKSKCCGADIKPFMGVEGTGCYICSECDSGCDVMETRNKSEEPQITKLSTVFKISHKGYKIRVEKAENGSLTILPTPTIYDNEGFVFKGSKPKTVREIGEILIKISEL